MSVNSKMTAIADKIRTLRGISGTMGLDTMATHIGNEQTAITAALAALVEKGVDVPAGSTSDALAGLIEAIESGGEESFTFTPAETGLLPLDVEDYESIKAVFWYNTGNIEVGTTDEGIAGFSILNSASTQQVVCLYNNGRYPNSLAANVYHSNNSFHGYTESDKIQYGAAVLRKVRGSAVTVYVNAESEKGLRVGATYKVIIQRV